MFEIACGKPLWHDGAAAEAADAPPIALARDAAAAPAVAAATSRVRTGGRIEERTGERTKPHPEARCRIMPRERLRESGPAALSDLELVALLLGSGLRGHDVFDVAGSLLGHFGSLRAMLDAQREEFEDLRGIGPAKASQLVAVLELARRALAEQLEERPLIDSPGAVEDYLRLLIGGRGYEVFVCLFLDVRHRLIRTEESTRGSLTRMAVYPREIVRRALMLNAASLIVAHNHPSGAVHPSASDRRLTRVLRETLALVEVQLVDHLIIGTQETFSFARHGLD